MGTTDTITIPRAEYDRLVAAAEDLADVRVYDEAMAEGEESVPHDVMVRLVEGENPITVFRELRGMSKAGLARAAGADRVQLHNIEGGKRRGPVDTLARIAAALDVTVDDLI